MRIYVTPKEGMKIREPGGRHLPPEGKWVANTGYWRRRISYGDVTEGEPPPAAPKKKTKKKDGDA